MRRSRMNGGWQLLAAATLIIAWNPPASAQPAPDFAGKTVTVVSSFGPGGGYTIYAQLLARHLGAHLPGHPTVVVRNMPGAGGLSGTNYLYNVAPHDGTT